MKFKLKKSEHLNKFQLFNKIEKLKLSTRENKAVNGDSLVFKSTEQKLYIHISNDISSAYVYLCDLDDEGVDFAIDSNLFTNAFSNFPVDEIQFSFIKEENQLVFGNKKTRVSLKTSSINGNSYNFEELFFINNQDIWSDLSSSNLQNAFKYSSFSCAPDFDEYPYTSIMLFMTDGKFNTQSSDKHRISIYGEKYSGEASYLISKNQAELTSFFIPKNSGKYSIHKGKLLILWEDGGFSTAIDNNTYQSVYNTFTQFFQKSEHITNFTINKNDVLRSIKFISSISSSHNFYIKGSGKELVFSSSNNEKGAVIDKIQLSEDIKDFEASYLVNHFTKALELLNMDEVLLSFEDYNGYTICIVQDVNYNHLMFPME